MDTIVHRSKNPKASEGKKDASKPETEEKNEYPIGRTQGTVSQKNMTIKTASKPLLALQCCYVAYGNQFLKPALFWTSKTMDRVLAKATQLYESAVEGLSSTESMTDSHLVQCFEFKGYTMQMVLPGETLKGVLKPPEPVAKSSEPVPKSCIQCLKKFFAKAKSCIFVCDKKSYLIWKDKAAYYLFDPRGRRYDGKIDPNRGYITLFCFEILKYVDSFLVNDCGLKTDDSFAMTEIKMKQLLKKNHMPPETLEISKNNKWRVLDVHRAILRGTLHVGNDCFKNISYEMGIVSCIMAVIYSRISRPNSWNGRHIDKIIMFAFTFLYECNKNSPNEAFGLKSILSEYKIGRHVANIKIRQKIASGKLLHTIHYKQNDLYTFIWQLFFNSGEKFLLVRIENYAFVLWKSDDMYYLYDPYPRNSSGGTTEKLTGRSCVLMHSTIESMAEQFITKLLNIGAKQVFTIDGLWVSVRCTKSNHPHSNQADDDNVSLVMNESIDDIHLPKIVCNSMATGADTAGDTEYSSDDDDDDGNLDDESELFDVEDLDGSDHSKFCYSSNTSSDNEYDEYAEPNNIFGIPNDAFDKWKLLNLTDSQIYKFYNMDGSMGEKKKWIQLKLTAERVDRLKELGCNPCQYEDLMKLGFNYTDVIAMKECNLTAQEYANMRDSSRELLKLKPEQRDNLRKLGVPSVEFNNLIRQGFTYEDILAMKELNMSPEEYAKMKNINLGPNANLIDFTKLNTEQVEKLRKLGVASGEFDSLIKQGFTYEDIVAMKELNMSPEEYAKMKNIKLVKGNEDFKNLTPEQMDQIRKLGMSSDEYNKLIKQGFTHDDILAMKAKNMTPEEYAKSKGFKIMDFNSNIGDIPKDDLSKWKILKLTDSQLLKFHFMHGLMIEKKQWIQKTKLRAEQVFRLQQLNVTLSEYEELTKQGFTYDDIITMKTANLTPKEYVKMKKSGSTPDEENRKKFVKYNLNSHDIEKLLDLNITPDEFAEFRKRNLKLADCALARKYNFSAEKYAKLKAENITEMEFEQMIEYEINTDDYIKMKKAGLTLDNMVRIQDSGFGINMCLIYLKYGVTPAQMLDFRKMELDGDDLLAILAAGLTYTDIELAVSGGLKSDELTSWTEISRFTGKEILDMHNKGLTPENFKEIPTRKSY